MAITVVGAFIAGAAGSTSANTTYNYGTELGISLLEDDVVFVFYGIAAAVDLIMAGKMITSGYTLLDEGYSDDTNDANFALWYKVQGSTPDTNVVTGPSGATSDAKITGVLILRGVDTSTPIDVTTPTPVAVQNTSDVTPPAITPTTSGARIISCAFTAPGATAGNYTVPGSFDQSWTGGGSDNRSVAMAIAIATWSGSGAFTPSLFDHSVVSGSASAYGITIAVRPAGGGATQITAADATSATTIDGATISSVVNTVNPADATAATRIDAALVNTPVFVNDLSAASRVDATSITTNNTVTAAELTVATRLDGAALSNVHNDVTAAELSVASSIDATALANVHSDISAAELAVATIVDASAITPFDPIESFATPLPIAVQPALSLAIGEVLENLLVFNLSAATRIDGDVEIFVPAYEIEVAALDAATRLDAATIIFNPDIVVAELTSATQIDGASLTTQNVISVAEIAVPTSLDNATVSLAAITIVPQDMFSAATLDNVTIAFKADITVAELAVATTIDNAVLIAAVTPADLTAATSIDQASIIDVNVEAADLTAVSSIDAALLRDDNIIAADLVSPTSTDVASLTVNYVISAAEIFAPTRIDASTVDVVVVSIAFGNNMQRVRERGQRRLPTRYRPARIVRTRPRGARIQGVML